MAFEETSSGIRRKVKRKRPGTLGICALIQNKYNVDAVPHILCYGFTKEETEDFMIELKFLGIDNVLAVRGDHHGPLKPRQSDRTHNEYAVDLVSQIKAMNEGHYLEDDLLDATPSDFCIGVSGYPEKHFEAPNLAADIRRTKEKVDAGADYIVTQMFFDNVYYRRFVAECRKAGIEVPIIPGLKILTLKSQLTSIPRNFKVEIPPALADEVAAAKPEHVMDIGVEWAKSQVEDLFTHDIPAAHFYIMQSSTAACRLMDQLKLS